MEQHHQHQQTALLPRQDSLQEGETTPGELLEPQRKKRCIRFPSDLSSEDPLLVGDSGFGDLPRFEEENGDVEVSSYFTSDDLNDLPEKKDGSDDRGVTTSLLPQNTQDSSFSSTEETQHLPETQESRSSSASSNPDLDSSLSSSDADTSCDLSFLFSHKEIAENPMRAAMLQRFLSQYRNNPNDGHLQHLLSLILSGPEFMQRRNRLRHVSTIQDAARLLRCSKRIMVLTGAGISVSCGIPDFRSKDGLYSRVAKVFPELQDPQSVFDIRLFRRDPRPFFLTAKELYPGQFQPSPSHRFIKRLEDRGRLLRNYSQNIDTLETIAGIEKVTMCHGSFATATCIRCRHQVSADAIKEKVLKGEVPFCTNCSSEEEWSKIKFPLGPKPVSITKLMEEEDLRVATEASQAEATQQQGSQANDAVPSTQAQQPPRIEDDDDDSFFFPELDEPLPPVVKPDIVFFGEDLPDEFHTNLTLDKPHCDLLLVIGSSLRVRPVSLIPGMINPDVPQILINREPLPQVQFDVELYGNSDEVIAQLASMMGPDFSDLAKAEPLMEVTKLMKDGEEEQNPAAICEPKSEHDFEALKACWEPKKAHNIVEKLPPKSYLKWRPHQYVFDGADIVYDPDDDESDDDSSDEEDSSGDDEEEQESSLTSLSSDLGDNQEKGNSSMTEIASSGTPAPEAMPSTSKNESAPASGSNQLVAPEKS